MEYLLNQQEYNDLITRGKTAQLAVEATLQNLCTKVADHMPIKFWGRTEATPWGCILTLSGRTDYCDECPVQEVCPHTNKRWSK